MSVKLAYLHTVPSLVGLFQQLSKEIFSDDVEVFHIADEVLLKMVLDKGGLSPLVYWRVAEHAMAAEQAGADAIQLTCSSISPCADACQPLVSIPILKVDEPMVDQAIRIGDHIGILATAQTTLSPTTDLVMMRANLAGKQVQVDPALCEGAFAALLSGQTETHDKIVSEYLQESISRNQVVLLAQASMSRVLENLPIKEVKAPVLTSPRLAVQRVMEVLDSIKNA